MRSILANHKKKKFALGLIALVMLGGLAVSARAWLAPAAMAGSAVPVTASAKPPSAAALATPNPVRIEAELVTIRPTGFEPAQITRPAGPFILAVENRSGLQSVKLRLYRVQVVTEPTCGLGQYCPVPPPLFEVTVTREQLDWSDLESLPPGNYALRSVSMFLRQLDDRI